MNRTELINSSPAVYPGVPATSNGKDIEISPTCCAVIKPLFVCDTRPRLELAFEIPILKTARRRRVRFALELNKGANVQYTTAGDVLTSQEKMTVWYSKREMYENQIESQRLAAKYKEQHADSLEDSSELVLKFIDTSSIRGSIASSSSASECTEVLNYHRDDCRGLEWLLYPAIAGRRAMSIKHFLATQSRIPEDVQPEMKARVLRLKSLQLSKPSRTMAGLLAYGDSIEVIHLVRKDLVNLQ